MWSLGCLAFELLIGRSPFVPYSNAPAEDVESAILSGTPTCGARAPIISKYAAIFLRAALARDVPGRPSAAELLETAWLQLPPPAAQAAASSPHPAERGSARDAPPAELFARLRTASAPLRLSGSRRRSFAERAAAEGDSEGVPQIPRAGSGMSDDSAAEESTGGAGSPVGGGRSVDSDSIQMRSDSAGEAPASATPRKWSAQKTTSDCVAAATVAVAAALRAKDSSGGDDKTGLGRLKARRTTPPTSPFPD